MYLDTNGPDGEIDIADIDFDGMKLEHNPALFSMSDSLYSKIFITGTSEPVTESGEYTIQPNVNAVTSFTPEQSVNDIRTEAPNHFKTGNRLITNRDYEYYIKNSSEVKSQLGYAIADVKCMNNTEFVATFYKWLYE